MRAQEPRQNRLTVFGWHVPERVFCVKGILAVFFAHLRRKEPQRAFLLLSSFFLVPGNGGFGSVIAVFSFEVVEPFFSARLHPNTSLRESIRHVWRMVRFIGT
jgi:hypothetical protein